MRNNGLQRVTSRLGVVEISVGVRLKPHRKFMEVLGHLMVVVEAFEEVDFLIAVQIMQYRQLIAAGEMDLLVDDFH